MLKQNFLNENCYLSIVKHTKKSHCYTIESLVKTFKILQEKEIFYMTLQYEKNV